VGVPKSDPDFSLAGFSLWVHQWQYPAASNYDDANWLVVTAEYRSPRTRVVVEGPIVQSFDLRLGLERVRELYRSLEGSATFGSLDPGFEILLEMKTAGQIDLTVDITPDIIGEDHQFRVEIDQSYLPAAIAGLEGILTAYPIRGTPDA
jgi:hypothetical protein